jgi:hypothetical protein
MGQIRIRESEFVTQNDFMNGLISGEMVQAAIVHGVNPD